jgi:alpha-ketoglutarate-dependent taurine dioxygenase
MIEGPPIVSLSVELTELLLSRRVPDSLPAKSWPRREERIATHPAVVPITSKVIEDVRNGPGFSILRLDNQFKDEAHLITVAFWNLFTCFTEPLPHSINCDLVYRVEHSAQTPSASRYYSQSNIGGDIHTDGTYIHVVPPYYVGLICLQQASCGGESILVDGRRIYAELRSNFPEALHFLERGYHFECDGQIPGRKTIRRQIIGKTACSLQIQYLRRYIEMGHRRACVPFEPEAVRSLDILDELLAREDLRHIYRLRSGEMLVHNNHIMLHGRTAFADGHERSSKRLLIRLWGKAA